MYSPIRTFFVGLNIFMVALLVILGTPFVTTAAALPVASSQITHNADYASAPQNASASTLVKHVTPAYQSKRSDVFDILQTRRDDLQARYSKATYSKIHVLNNYYQNMCQHASNIHTLWTSSSGSAVYEQQGAAELSQFHTNLAGFQDVLAQLAADKGLANYDSTDDLQTLLKNLVNAVKYLLNDLDEMVYNLPAVGPTLGPIVYDIKCLLDEVLDAVENLTDAIINAIAPLLQGLIGDATNTACNSGLKIAGLCLVL